MPSTTSDPLPPHLEIPVERVWTGRFWLVSGLIVAVFGVVGAWKAGLIRPSRLWTPPVATLKTLTVDEGTLYAVVTENGSLESSNNATIRCQVEALIGLIGGAAQPGGTTAGRPGGVGGAQGGRPGGMGQAGGGQGGQQQQQAAPAAKKKMQRKAGAAGAGKDASKGGSGSALVTGTQTNASVSTGASGASSGSASNGGAGGSGGAGMSSSSNAGGASGGTTGGTPATKPVIRSFAYEIPPYEPLRPKTPAGAQQPVKQAAVDPSMAGGRRGGGRGGDPLNPEKPGSTRIISILPEGTRVKAGAVVCELDAAAFRDEVQAQKIRWSQAKALVEQAKSILEVNEITCEEYRNGIYPQDVQLVRQYLTTCGIDSDRSRRNLEWSRATFAKGYRAAAQLKADAAAVEQAELSEHEAKSMLYRLEKYTGPRLTKNLLAKIEAIRADKLAQDSVYQLESDRLRRLEEMVANCTLRAPRDGIVVYANVANGWGQTQNPIQEGVTVRQGQALINLPDPNHMRVRARINESKVSSIHPGQKVRIRVDAFPNQPLMGTVEGITPIPAPSNRSGQDVRVYFATVEIDSGGFDELRPGLSAEVTFLINQPRTVTRVPLQAVRWFQETPFAAVADRGATTYHWRRLQVGQSDTSYLEVVSGLGPGDRVIARPDLLVAPARTLTAPAFAAASPANRPRG